MRCNMNFTACGYRISQSMTAVPIQFDHQALYLFNIKRNPMETTIFSETGIIIAECVAMKRQLGLNGI